jgi:AcrR family transcriptional regulator
MTAAVNLADRDGLDSLTMRNLAQELGVEAMSLYYHVPGKEAVLDGAVESVMVEINDAVGEIGAVSDWKEALRARILAARRVLLIHPWASRVIESRTAISPETMRYYDGVIQILRTGGFDYDLIHHAMHALGSRALGFSQELFEPDDTDGEGDESTDMLEAMAAEFPYLTEMVAEVSHDDPDTTLGWCDDQTEFVFGIDLLLDGLERLKG